jgi:hypothetical protein
MSPDALAPTEDPEGAGLAAGSPGDGAEARGPGGPAGAPPPPGEPPPASPTRWDAVAWGAVFLALSAALQFVVGGDPFDADTAYHAAVGRLVAEHGLLKAFPWTPFSWLADHYADKELLFHLFFAPLSWLPWTVAAKVVGTLSGATLLLALFLVLRAQGVRLAGPWTLVPLVASDVFLFRFALVRPHLLSIALSLAALWAAARGRLLVLGLVALVYPWAYVAWQLPLVLVAVAELARLVSGERLRWRPAAVALLGTAAGIAIHPNALNLVRFSWVVIADVLVRNAWGGGEVVELGLEFLPFSAEQWLRWMLGASAMALAAVALAWRRRREDPVAVAFALGALLFGGLTLRTARFAEYFVPFSVAALALSVQGLRPRWRLAVPAAALAGSLAYSGAPLLETLEGLRARPSRLDAQTASAMRARIPPGSQVFTCEWGLTGTLMLALPDRRFIVALDPTLFHLKDPELYRLWVQLVHRPPDGAADVIRERFGARYVVCFWDARFRKLMDQLAFAPGVRTVLFTDDWSVYDLGERDAGDGVGPGPDGDHGPGDAAPAGPGDAAPAGTGETAPEGTGTMPGAGRQAPGSAGPGR